jgi:spore coat protein U-like protein
MKYSHCRLLIFSGILFLLGIKHSFSATATGTLSVTATIAAACSVNNSSSTVAFGTYTSSTTDDVTGSVAVTCTNTTSYVVSLGVGSGTGASYTNRVMTGGTSGDLLNYNLYTTNAYTTVFGDGTGATATVSGTGSGVQQLVNVFGRIPSGQTTPGPDSYSDSVNITVTY